MSKINWVIDLSDSKAWMNLEIKDIEIVSKFESTFDKFWIPFSVTASKQKLYLDSKQFVKWFRLL